jgi:hypothetical protein
MDKARLSRLNIQDHFIAAQQMHAKQMENGLAAMEQSVTAQSAATLAAQLQANLQKVSRHIHHRDLNVQDGPKLLAYANQKATQEALQEQETKLEKFREEADAALVSSNKTSGRKALNSLPELYQILINRFTHPESRNHIKRFLIFDTKTPEHAPKDDLFISHLFELPKNIQPRDLKKALNRWQHKGKWAAPLPPVKSEPLETEDVPPTSNELILAKDAPSRKPRQLFIR